MQTDHRNTYARIVLALCGAPLTPPPDLGELAAELLRTAGNAPERQLAARVYHAVRNHEPRCVHTCGVCDPAPAPIIQTAGCAISAADVQSAMDRYRKRLCPYASHADDCDCRGMGGDR